MMETPDRQVRRVFKVRQEIQERRDRQATTELRASRETPVRRATLGFREFPEIPDPKAQREQMPRSVPFTLA
jgi:hypothetical protein